MAVKDYFEGLGTSVPSQEDLNRICSEALDKHQDLNRYRLFARRMFGNWIHVDDPPCSFSDSSELEPSARFSVVEKLFDYIGNREAQELFYEELRTRTTPGPLGCFFWEGLLICCAILLLVKLLFRSRNTEKTEIQMLFNQTNEILEDRLIEITEREEALQTTQFQMDAERMNLEATKRKVLNQEFRNKLKIEAERDELTILRTQVEDWSSEVQAQKREIKENQEYILSQKCQLEKEKQNLTILQEEMANDLKEISGQKLEFQNAKDKLMKEQETVEAHKQDLIIKEDKMRKKEKKLMDTERGLEAERQRIAEEKRTVDVRQQKLKEDEERLANKKSTLMAKIADLQQVRETLNEEKLNFKKQQQILAAEKQDLNEEKKKVRIEKETLVKEKEKLNKTMADLEQQKEKIRLEKLTATANGQNKERFDSTEKTLSNKLPKIQQRKVLVPTGLTNFGNSCYMNATLQVLMNVLQDYADQMTAKHWNSNSGTKGAVTKELCKLMKARENSQQNSAVGLKHTVENFNSVYKGYEQQDAHEFLLSMLNWLHEELNQGKESPNKTVRMDDLPNSATEQERAETYWKRCRKSDDSLITALFQGLKKMTKTCRRCKGKSVTFETFTANSLTFVDNVKPNSLNEMLAASFKDERLEDYRCEHCLSTGSVERGERLFKLPKFLVFHLNRFYFCPRRLNFARVDSPVDFPFDSFQITDSYGDGGRSVNRKYRLCGTVNHFGRIDSGHYTSLVRTANNTWYDCNDSRISAANHKNRLYKDSAYILIYKVDDI